jgi:hypothetical protein
MPAPVSTATRFTPSAQLMFMIARPEVAKPFTGSPAAFPAGGARNPAGRAQVPAEATERPSALNAWSAASCRFGGQREAVAEFAQRTPAPGRMPRYARAEVTGERAFAEIPSFR